MTFEEIPYDINEDYGFFCNLDDDNNSITSLSNKKKNNVSIPEEHIPINKNEIINNYKYKLVIKFRTILINSICVIGTCISMIIMCYKFIHTEIHDP
jgi:hypothetical protein